MFWRRDKERVIILGLAALRRTVAAAWIGVVTACGFSVDATSFNETIERLMLQTNQAQAMWAFREGAVREKPEKGCGWL